jgi:16S rRNA processing protein RimM
VSGASDHEYYVTIARVLRSRGNRGEVAAEDLGGRDRFLAGESFTLRTPGGELRDVTLEGAWRHQGRLVLKFAGVDTIGAAESLRGCEVQVRRGELGPAPPGQYYFEDLIGCRVIEAGTERLVGEVEDVLETGASLLLQVRSGGREILIPFAEGICVDIAPAEKSIRVRLPEGLEDLNS